LRRVSRPRQSPIPLRSTSFRPAPKPPPRSIEDPALPRPSIKSRKAVRPLTAPEPTVRVAYSSIELTLPVPPSVNHQYATVNGRRLLSAKGRAYKDLVGQQILVALAQSPHRGTLRQLLQQANLSLSIHFFFASALRRDTDGGLKIAQDALCEGLGLNDNRVVEIHLYKFQDRDNPRMDIRLSVAQSASGNPLTPPSSSPRLPFPRSVPLTSSETDGRG
jgi:crossover junction endodeoxyribonuclease RusA